MLDDDDIVAVDKVEDTDILTEVDIDANTNTVRSMYLERCCGFEVQEMNE